MKPRSHWNVRSFTEVDLGVIAQCFSDRKWLKTCCMDTAPRWEGIRVQKYLSEGGKIHLFAVDKDDIIIGFCRYFSDGDVSIQYEGGVLPGMIDTGYGVFVTILSASYIFWRHPEVSSINGYINCCNRHSLKIHEKIGFERQSGRSDDTVLKYTVTRDEFADNAFVHRVLARLCFPPVGA